MLLRAYNDPSRCVKFELESATAKFRAGTLTVEITKTSKGYGSSNNATEKYELDYTSDKGGGFVSNRSRIFIDKNILDFLGMMKLQPRYFGDKTLCFDGYGKYGITKAKFKKLVIIINTSFD